MTLVRQRSVTDALVSSAAAAESDGLRLHDGSRVAVVGGGPAGSFFSYFLLKTAEAVGLQVDVDIYEPRSFLRCGPAGCNHCGGIVSESLVQILATEGINLPAGVVQAGIESYVVHMDVGSVQIASPAREQRIAALYRGGGPRDGDTVFQGGSFDAYLQGLAVQRGARVVRKLVTGLAWRDGRPWLLEADGTETSYDLVTVASGVNSNLLESLEGFSPRPAKPRTTRTYICEFRSSRDEIRRLLGNSMHVFLLDIPRLEFAALIPKGDFVTLCMLGDELDQELVHRFLQSPVVRRCFPADAAPSVCCCSPLINIAGTTRPFADRLLLIGDSGVTRLYKDGIGAAFRTSKAAAATAVLHGISADAFRHGYWPACHAIAADNAIGRLLFGTTTVFKHSRISRRAILRMTRREQASRGVGRMSSMLWNMFTGSAPYREILVGALHPAFVGGLLWNLAAGAWPSAGRTRAA